MEDDDIMYFGGHKGKMLKDIPDDYLLWLYNQKWVKDSHEPLYSYIKENLDAIKENIKNQR